MQDDTLAAIETAIGHNFRDRAFLIAALTHPSYSNECVADSTNNERLEFLGDAVVNLAVAAALYERLPNADEGRLTRARARAVGRKPLSQAARALDLGSYLRLGRGASLRDCISGNDSVLSSAFEAVTGAIFLDAGFEAAAAFVRRNLELFISNPGQFSENKDPKTILQERCQAVAKVPPRYQVFARTGPDHSPWFEVRVFLSDGRSFPGFGRTRKEAEQDAASNALEELGG